MKTIINLKLGKVQRRITENHKIKLTYDTAVVDEVARRCNRGRKRRTHVDNILTNTLLPEISRQLLGHIAKGKPPSEFTLAISADGAFAYS